MPPSVLESTLAQGPAVAREEHSAQWEAPCGPPDARLAPPGTTLTFVYRGYADSHLRGQTCRVLGAASADERSVAMACGCRISVPWWTLEPQA